MADKIFESPHQWNLYDASGRSSMGGNFGSELRQYNHNIALLADISIKSTWPDRLSDKPSFYHLSNDFVVNIFQIIFSRERIYDLLFHISRWMESPGNFQVELCLDPKNQSFIIGVEVDRSNTTEKQTCRIKYSGQTFLNGEWSFRIDQSCIRILSEELRESVKLLFGALDGN